MLEVLHGILRRRRIESRVGCVAEYCPICRSIMPFELSTISATWHFCLFVPLGAGTALHHRVRCTGCGSSRYADPDTYSSVRRRRDVPVEKLIAGTYPGIREAYAAPLAADEKLRSGQPFPPGSPERREQLMQPFRYLADEVEERYTMEDQFDRASATGCLGTIVLSGGLFIGTASMRWTGAKQDAGLLAALVVGIAGLIYTLAMFHTAPDRHVRTHIVPRLARALRPLKATGTEISECLAILNREGLRIGVKIPKDVLLAALRV